MNVLTFGGLDLAQRVDNSALNTVKLEDKKIEQIGQKQWPHIEYNFVFDDCRKINQIEKWFSVGYDRTGVGDAVKHLIPVELLGIFKPVVLSAPKKFEIISEMNGLFSQNQLIIHDREIYREITEQELIKSDAGNLLYRHPQGFHDDRFWSFGLAVDQAVKYIRGKVTHMAASSRSKHINLEDLLDDYEKYI